MGREGTLAKTAATVPGDAAYAVDPVYAPASFRKHSLPAEVPDILPPPRASAPLQERHTRSVGPSAGPPPRQSELLPWLPAAALRDLDKPTAGADPAPLTAGVYRSACFTGPLFGRLLVLHPYPGQGLLSEPWKICMCRIPTDRSTPPDFTLYTAGKTQKSAGSERLCILCATHVVGLFSSLRAWA